MVAESSHVLAFCVLFVVFRFACSPAEVVFVMKAPASAEAAEAGDPTVPLAIPAATASASRRLAACDCAAEPGLREIN
ncbi:hypothetical protein Psi02_31380 [Planotetraspora silvatica]|uniref:Uncharacterized protein n=1 Tax=Planotetraspora silvatica TaxID=234614 RepID=A0A8J3XMP3_9ACTN|nr:hypothetical protein Psi02_31380 [Planotetraspora silvatica]